MWLVPLLVLAWITKNQFEQMANEAMFATISPFLVIYDTTSKGIINLHKLTKLELLTLAWMLTIIQTPPRSNFPPFDLLFLCSHIACLFHFGNTNLLCHTFSHFGIKSSKRCRNKMSPRTLSSPSKYSLKRNVKYKGESRINHDPYVWYQWRYHMCE
jgi:hypothetical protein